MFFPIFAAMNYRYFFYKALISLFFAGSMLVCGYGQSDTVTLEELVIRGKSQSNIYYDSLMVLDRITREEIASVPVESVNELLEAITMLDVRKRGPMGVQADISIKGGGFDQALILLDGVKINNPQTGHHHLNIPVDIQDVERIEVLKGAGAQMLTPGAFSGAINIITRKPESRNSLDIELGGGQHNLHNARVSGNYTKNTFANYLSLSRRATDGYIDNTDFAAINGFYHSRTRTDAGPVCFSVGHNDKRFGANSFYTPAYPEQYEHTRSSFMHMSFITGDKLKVMPNIYFQRHQDRFELFRYDPADWYSGHNYHLTTVQGTDLHLRYESAAGVSALGASYRMEQILSNVLGEPMEDTLDVPFEAEGVFTHSKRRDNININLNHRYSYKGFSLDAGLLVNKVSGYNWNLNGGGALNWLISKAFILHASASQAMRLPTFTDLYYDGPTNKGNPLLKPEKAINFETGITYRQHAFNINMTGFYRRSRDLIDWVKSSDTVKIWQTINHTKINAAGIDVSGKIDFKRLFNEQQLPFNYMRIGYTFVESDKEARGMVSKYALDHLQSKFHVSLNHKIYKKLSASWKYILQDRAGTFIDYESGKEMPYKPFSLLDVRLYWSGNLAGIFLDASNLLDTQYQDLSNVPLPGRWVKGGIRIKLRGAGKK